MATCSPRTASCICFSALSFLQKNHPEILSHRNKPLFAHHWFHHGSRTIAGEHGENSVCLLHEKSFSRIISADFFRASSTESPAIGERRHFPSKSILGNRYASKSCFLRVHNHLQNDRQKSSWLRFLFPYIDHIIICHNHKFSHSGVGFVFKLCR